MDEVIGGIYTNQRGDFQKGPTKGYSRTIKAMQNDAGVVFSCAERGRNPENPSDRTVGAKTKQRIEVNENNVSNCITTVQKDSMVLSGKEDEESTKYRIRKLTPRECFRLMSFSDEDYEKAASVNSETQLYKQAGNSIVENCLVAIFGQLIEGKEDIYKNYVPPNIREDK